MSAQAKANQDPKQASMEGFPSYLLEEIERAKALFQKRYHLNPDVNQPAEDPTFPYPIYWWHLMEYHLCVQMKEIEQSWEQQAAELAREQEAKLASLEEISTPKPAADEKEHLQECLSKIASYAGKEGVLEAGLIIPVIEGFAFIDIVPHIISLAIKFGFQTPLSGQELSSFSPSKRVEASHPAFRKYAPELGGATFLDFATILEWEYEGANTFLQQFTPKGYYCSFETDYGWGVFEDGAFDLQEPY